MGTSAVQYKNVKAFLKDVERMYLDLPKRLQCIARELNFHKDGIAFMSVNELSALIGVPPSALVRFAKTFGFSGFAEMKQLFQQNVSKQIQEDKYSERIKALNQKQALTTEEYPYCEMVNDIVLSNLDNLQTLKDPKIIRGLHRAVELLKQGKNIWVMAAGRSFAAAAYFTYLLRYTEKPIHWINGLCFNLEGQTISIKKEDVLLVISYAPYAKESIHTVKAAHKSGAKIIAVTDSHLNDIAKLSDQVLEIHEHSSFGFRSLTNTMCLLQVMFLMYAANTDMNKVETR